MVVATGANKLTKQTHTRQPNRRDLRFAIGRKFISHRDMTFMRELSHKQGKPKDHQAYFQVRQLICIKALTSTPSVSRSTKTLHSRPSRSLALECVHIEQAGMAAPEACFAAGEPQAVM